MPVSGPDTRIPIAGVGIGWSDMESVDLNRRVFGFPGVLMREAKEQGWNRYLT